MRVRQKTFNLAGHREEDHTQPPPPHWRGPQRPRHSLPQIPSTGGTAININSFNKKNTDINGAFNNNSQNYCEYEVSMQHPNLFLKFVKIQVVTVCLPTIDRGCQDLIMVQFQILHFVVTFFHHCRLLQAFHLYLPLGYTEVANSVRQYKLPSKQHSHNRWARDLAVTLFHACHRWVPISNKWIRVWDRILSIC